MPRPKSPPKPIMSREQLRRLLAKHRLRQEDLAWMTGCGVRQARAYAIGEYDVPLRVALILMAYDEGLITAKWLAKKIKTPPPA